MTTHNQSIAISFSLVALLHIASDVAAGEKPAPQRSRAEIQAILTDCRIDTKDWPVVMSFEDFLPALAAKLPEGKRIAFTIDAQAFGKQFPKVASAKVHISLQPLTNVSPAMVLRRALAQVSAIEEVDYAFRPTGVVITRPSLAAHSAVYDIRDIMEHTPELLADLKVNFGDDFRDLKPMDGAAVILRYLTNESDVQPSETMQLLNRTQLSVSATPRRHEEIGDALAALRRMTDEAVVMNARIYEVDRAFFTKNVAPLFRSETDQPTVVNIDGPLFKAITRQKLILKSEDRQTRREQNVAFLSHESVFRYASGPHPTKPGQTLIGTGVSGVSFQVRARISLDRRYLRIQITQNVAQLAGFDKVKVLDVATGKDVEVESPNIRKTSVQGTVQLADGNAILMPIQFRPAGKENEEKVWLLVARPFIWIEEEVKEIERRGGKRSAQSIWDGEVHKEEEPREKPAPPLRLDDESKEILQAVITDVLTNPSLKSTREFYGTEKDRTLTVVDSEKIGWPGDFKPVTNGYKLIEVRRDPFVNHRRVLAIRVDKFDLKQKKSELFDTPIEVCVFNGGGSANGAVIGGCSVYYTPKRVNKRWTVECAGLLDP